MSEESIRVRALRPFKSPGGIWIMPGNVVALPEAEANAAFRKGDGVPARTGVDEAAVINLRETTMVRGNGKCRTFSQRGRRKNPLPLRT